jgi:phage terminase large subunit GpA-like protein
MTNPAAEGVSNDAAIVANIRDFLRPPRELSLSQWADEFFYLSVESSADPGRWKTIPYQRGIMDAITDPTVVQVTVKKSARIGYTKIINAAIGYFMHQDPCPIMVVQPRIEDGKGYSKEEIAPMLRDVPVLAALVKETAPNASESTILHKTFPGGVLAIVGANSATGFRRVSRRVVIFDEVDGYPPSAGDEGDQIKLGIRRTEHYVNRKIIAGSTPLVAGVSRIDELFDAGDRRHYHVPCPQCGHMDILTFSEESERGHFMRWPKDQPSAAYFVCRANGCVIENKDKHGMISRGEWRADAPFSGHASFHIWAAYSLSPNATWGDLATEFLASKRGGPEKLKTFVNTVLGETWHDRGEAPDWERIYQRREKYTIGSVPEGVIFLTAGVDVQKDRFVYEVVGWAANKESWSVDSGVLSGDSANERAWGAVDELLGRTYESASGVRFSVAMLGVDSGYNTQQVYNWARRYPMSRVIAVKGTAEARTLVGIPSPVDVLMNGRRHQRGYRVWPIGVSIAKAELYGWLRLVAVEGEARPGGFCHFPEYSEEFFRQLTAEHLVTTRKRNGFRSTEWQILPGRENHQLDARIYARAAASVKGIDRHLAALAPTPDAPTSSSPAPPAREAPKPAPASTAPGRETSATARGPKPGGWLRGRNPGGWLGRRR